MVDQPFDPEQFGANIEKLAKEEFRTKAALAAMQAFITEGAYSRLWGTGRHTTEIVAKAVAERSVECANALVAELEKE